MNRILNIISIAAVVLLAAACASSHKSENGDDAAQQESKRPAEFANDDELLDYIQKVHFNYMWDGCLLYTSPSPRD